MNAGACPAIRELLPEFALGVLTGAAAAEVVDHTSRCVACRTALAELSGVTDALLLIAPEREPSAAFTPRVAAALDARAARSRGSRSRRNWILAAAAAVVIALVAGAVFVGRATGPTRTVATTGTGAGSVEEAPMIGAGGRLAGRVLLSRGTPNLAVVAVRYGTLPPGNYAVTTAGPGPDVTAGTVFVDADGRGTWGGALHDTGLTAVRIVDDTGHVLCEARFGRGSSHRTARAGY